MPILRLTLILFCLCGLTTAASAGCVWRGTAPFCSGSCKAGENQKLRTTTGVEYSGSGALCVTGSKALCCTAEQAPKAEANPDCKVAGTVRTDIAQSDCTEAQQTGCIRRLLNDEQYGNCILVNKRKAGKVVKLGKPKTPPSNTTAQKTASAVQATDVYDTNDGQSEARCTMNVGDSARYVSSKAGETDWVRLDRFSNDCGNKFGWVWNGGSLSIK